LLSGMWNADVHKIVDVLRPSADRTLYEAGSPSSRLTRRCAAGMTAPLVLVTAETARPGCRHRNIEHPLDYQLRHVPSHDKSFAAAGAFAAAAVVQPSQ